MHGPMRRIGHVLEHHVLGPSQLSSTGQPIHPKVKVAKKRQTDAGNENTALLARET
jgi:hypothetical protein